MNSVGKGVYVCIYIYLYAYTQIHTYTHEGIYAYIYIHTYIFYAIGWQGGICKWEAINVNMSLGIHCRVFIIIL